MATFPVATGTQAALINKPHNIKAMKSKLLMGGLLIAALTQSCSDDIISGNQSLPQGTEIKFGANLKDGSAARTFYGDETTANGVKVWPIYWNYGTMTADEVFIYSPQGNPGRNQAQYICEAEAPVDNKQSAANLTKKNAFGIQTGDTGTYDFYAIYPASLAKDGEATGTVIKGSMPYLQTAKFAGTATNPSTVIPEPSNTANLAYLTTADMNCCLMTGIKTGVAASDLDKPVELMFSPYATVLDITVNAPESNSTTGENTARITSITITETTGKAIAGDFSIDFSNPDSPTLSLGENTYSAISIDTRGYDKDNYFMGVPLQVSGQTLNVKAFLLPNTDISNLKVTVNVNMEQFSRTITTNSAIQPKQIHKVTLPYLHLGEGQLDKTTWIAQLDPRIFISELSLPGSALTFNSQINQVTGTTQTQTLSIEDQFNAGARVFQCHVNENLCIATSSGYEVYEEGTSTTPLTVENVITKYLKPQMEGIHSEEFCVLMLSDYITNSTTAKFQQLYTGLSELSQRLSQQGILAENVGPNTTINDVKGKIILKYQFNANVSTTSGIGYTIYNVGSKIQEINQWADFNGSKILFNWFTTAAGTDVQYAPLAWSNTGTACSMSTYDNTGRNISSKPSFTAGTGFLNLAAQVIYNGSTWRNGTLSNYYNSAGNANCSTKGQYTSPIGMYYLYTEQATASNRGSNISNTVNAIVSTYDQTAHNYFFMTYCGGTGATTLASTMRTEWTNAVGITISNNRVTDWGTKFAKIPYGWVLFDYITEDNDTHVEAVIRHNASEDFLLNRDHTSTSTTQTSPAGDVQGVNGGGSLF